MFEIREYISRSMSFDDYLRLIDDLLAPGKTTGAGRSEKMAGYTRLNRQRMARLEKTVAVSETVREQVARLETGQIWLVITEGWCGDAAQNVPVIEKLAALNSGIETRYILRDENPQLMDRFLTNGTRSIPKLIAIDARTYKILGTWGPRPDAGQQYFLKQRSEGVQKPELNELMQRWYNADRGQSLQVELGDLSRKWALANVSSDLAFSTAQIEC